METEKTAYRRRIMTRGIPSFCFKNAIEKHYTLIILIITSDSPLSHLILVLEPIAHSVYDTLLCMQSFLQT